MLVLEALLTRLKFRLHEEVDVRAFCLSTIFHCDILISLVVVISLEVKATVCHMIVYWRWRHSQMMD